MTDIEMIRKQYEVCKDGPKCKKHPMVRKPVRK